MDNVLALKMNKPLKNPDWHLLLYIYIYIYVCVYIFACFCGVKGRIGHYLGDEKAGGGEVEEKSIFFKVSCTKSRKEKTTIHNRMDTIRIKQIPF